MTTARPDVEQDDVCKLCNGRGWIHRPFSDDPYYEHPCRLCNADGSREQTPTLFLCGPSKCEHDYSDGVEIEGGWTAVCVKCGAKAIEEAAWD